MLVYRVTTQQTVESGANRLEAISGELEDSISDARSTALELSIEVQMYLNDKNELEKFIRRRKTELLEETNEICFNTYIGAPDWYIIPDFNEPEGGFDVTKRAWYVGAVRNGGTPYVTDPYVDALTGGFCYSVAVMLPDRRTVVAIDFKMDAIQQHISQMYHDDERNAVIVTQEGIIAGCTDESLIGKSLVYEMPDYAGIFSLAKSSDGSVHIKRRGENLFAASSDFGWYLIVNESNMSLYKNLYVQLLAITVLSLTVYVVIIVLFIRSDRTAKKAAEALKYKEEFISNVTAELQVPIRSILKSSSDPNVSDPDEFADRLTGIKEQAGKLSHMIGEMLSYQSIVRTEKLDTPLSNSSGLKVNRHFRTIIVIILVAVMAVSLYTNVNAVYSWGESRLQNEVASCEYQLGEWINTQKSILDMFCSIFSTHPEMLDDYEGTVVYLDEITKQFPEISVSYMTNPDLEHTVYMNNGWEPDEDWHVEDRDWYKELMASDKDWSISSPYYDEQTGLYCVTFCEKVYDARTGEFLGNFGIDFYMDKLVDILGKSNTDTGYAFLADASGDIINHPFGRYQMTENIKTNVNELNYNKVQPDGHTVRIIKDYDGSLKALIATTSDSSRFSVYVVSSLWMIYGSTILYVLVCASAFAFCIIMIYKLMTNLIELQENANLKLKESADAAIAADKAKSSFLAQMSHEIRTPINAVLGMNEMILRECTDSEIREYSRNIQSAGRTLLALINSILDFSKIEDGKMEIVPAEYDTALMISDLVAAVSPRASAKGLALRLRIDSSLPTSLMGDDVRIKQVISNLLTNAVKYTDSGSVTLTVRAEERTDDSVKLFVEIADTGIGIKEEDIDKLEVSFRRLDIRRNRNVEGTGLGMSIVTKLLRMMDSELNIESTYGKGSAFSFLLPQKIVRGEPMGDYHKRAASFETEEEETGYLYAPDARVLVTDDNEMNRKVAAALMKLHGITPKLAVSGEETIELLGREKFDIVFLDHMMPVLDGIDTLKILRARDLVGDTKMISLTANAIVGARESYIDAGFDDYLSKPIEPKQLEKMLARYLPAELVSYHEHPTENENRTEQVTDMEEKNISAFTDEELRQISAVCPELNVITGLGYCMWERDFYMEMLGEFANEERAETLEKCFAENDIHGYGVSVHSMKSAAKTVGALVLSEKARVLETAAKAGDTERIRQEHAELIAAFRETAENIRKIIEQFG